MLTTELIETVLTALPGKSVGLIGDLFLDRYLDIDASLNEPSIETGLTAYQVTRVRAYPGALGTVLNNLVALGVGRIVPVAIIGDDGEGYELLQELRKRPGVILDGILSTTTRRTPTYCKPMLNEAGIATELNRLDTKNRTPTPAELESQLIQRIEQLWPSVDAWILLDQVSEANCGVLTDRVREAILVMSRASASTFVLADSREQIGKFVGVAAKPNLDECRRAVGNTPGDPAVQLASITGNRVFCTRGDQGMALVEGAKLTTIPGYPVTGPIDICGAGDSCSAGITSAKVAGLTDVQAAAFGNLIASITVQQIGTTGTASPAQVRQRWQVVSSS